MPTFARYLLLSTLYFAQGLPFGFFVQALPVILREQGMSLTHIGGTSLLAVPWAFKFLWASWIDQRSSPLGIRGHYRAWILIMQVLMALLLTLAGVLDLATSLAPVLFCVFAINLVAATQDIATDALCVRLLTEKQRGIGNGIQVAGYRAGMVFGGGIILMFFETLGWSQTLFVMAGTITIVSAVMWRFDEDREIHSQAVASNDDDKGTPSIRGFFARAGILGWSAILVLYKTPEAFATGMVRPFLSDVGMSLAQVGELAGIYSFLSGMLGALFGGWVTSIIGRRRAFVIFGILQVLAVAAYIPIAIWPQEYAAFGPIGFALIVDHFFVGAATATLFTMMMDRVRTESPGLDYTIQASIVAISTGLFSTISGASADALGHADHFVVGGAASGVGLVIAFGIFFRFVKNAHDGVDSVRISPRRHAEIRLTACAQSEDQKKAPT